MDGPATSGRIRTPDQRLRVFVSSTLAELAAERQGARAAIERLRLTPVMFELGARPHPPRALYRSYLDQSDVFVGIYWQRYGWVAPDMEISGLEDEYLLSAGMPRLMYVKRPAPEVEPRLQDLLRRLKEEDTTSYKPFRDAAELERLLVDDLALLLTERFDAGHEPMERPPSVPNTLPVPITALLGRTAIVRDVVSLLESGNARLVTLTGPGGTGKTRLAVEVAAARADRYRDGVFFVDLSSEQEPVGAYAAIARAVTTLGAGDRQPLEALEQDLRNRHVLVVLDNFEQVTAAAPGVAGLMQHCPGLTLLVTSREALRVRGEKVVAVPPLSLPGAKAGKLDVEEALDSPAVRLFAERAAAMTPDFSITDDNVADAVAICERLDGLPLAIELAAARVNLFAVDELRNRLDTRLDLLQGGARDLPERQQTLRRAIEWSNDLLNGAERSVLRLFAVFTGARLADVEATSRRVPGLDSIDVVGGLGSLVDKSLVRSSRGLDGRPRFSMLRTIRDYATEQLDSAADLAEPVRQAHAEHYSERAVELQRALNEGDRSAGLSTMEDELGNLRTAWDHWMRSDAVDRLHELLEPLWGFHEARGDYAAAIELGDDLLGVLDRQPATAGRARDEYVLHLNVVRAIVAARGFTPDAERRMRTALERSEASTDARRHFTTLRSLAVLHLMQNDFESAAGVARDLLDIAEDQQDPTMLSDAHLVAGTVSVWRDGWDRAVDHFDASLECLSTTAPALARLRLGPHPAVVSHAVSGLAQWMVGLPDQAAAHSTRALELVVELGHPYSTAYALFHTALLDLWRTDLPAVAAKADELVRVAEAHDYAIWRALGTVLRGTAMVGLGEPDVGLAEVARGFSLYQPLSTPRVFWPTLLMIRAQAFAMAGRLDDAIAGMCEARDTVDESDPLTADMAIVHGDLLLRLSPPDVAAAEALFETAASLAATRGARMTQLQVSTRLLELARGTPRESQARQGLRDILDTFTEGFASPPVVAARAALDG